MSEPARRMHISRRKLLAGFRDNPVFEPKRSSSLKWLISMGYVEQGKITPAGREALAYAEIDPEEREALRLLPKLKGKTVCRQVLTPEAEGTGPGDGFSYFTEPDHKFLSAPLARLLISTGRLVPQEDGLFPGMSQTFRVASHA
jgi:hypothetical protein